MSAIAFAQAADPDSAPTAVRAMLGAMPERGADERDVASAAGASIGVARFDWERALAGPPSVARDGDVMVAADATLYYRDDLHRALAARGVRALDDSPAAWIAAAYRAWGERCAEHVEGDFAFVVWDAARRRVVAARDFAGRRPLYWAGTAGALRVASTLRGVLAGPGVSSAFDLAAIASDVGGIDGPADETAYAAIRRLPPGSTLVADPERIVVTPHWEPPEFRTGGRASLAEGAMELRALLARSVAERLAPAGPTAVSLSGGYDSTAVFASGASFLGQQRADDRALFPVSLSYPPDDPGHEDAFIDSAAAHWNARPRWIASGDVPALAALDARAAARDEPYPHPFESGLRALLRRGRAAGARVLLDGVGGDQLFEASAARLADYFRTGRWLRLALEWRDEQLDVREMFRRAVRPNMGSASLQLARLLRGGHPLADPDARSAPVSWLRPEALRALGVDERAAAPWPSAGGHAATEAAWHFRRPLLLRVNAQVGSFGLAEGVEERSPLYDRRLVAFAASRPVWERNRAGETKRLLRAAMRGLLPDSLLAPRAHRTGVPVAYLLRAIEAEMPHRLDSELQSPVLADLGLVEPERLRAAWDDYLRTGRIGLAVGLYVTLEIELWLRARAGAASSAVR